MKRRNMTLRKLAAQVGVSPGTLSKYGRGTTPGLDVAVRIARVLGLSLDELVWNETPDKFLEACPAPEEHVLLHELAEDLGLDHLLRLANLATQSTAWDITKVLIGFHPRLVGVRDLARSLPGIDQEDIRLSLLALKRKRIVVERRDSSKVPVFGLRQPVAEFSAREMGDLSHHVKRAVRTLLQEILPAVERGDGTGVLVTVAANVPRKRATEMLKALEEQLRREAKRYIDDSGTTAVHLVFGVAIRGDSC